MEELSLHILDIVENSLRAGAKDVGISIIDDSQTDSLTIEINDDGSGMDAATLKQAFDPFFTTQSVRKVGLGLSLFREAARATGGDLSVVSSPDQGTRIKATFQKSHVDRQPLGDITKTLKTLLVANPEVRFRCTHRIDDEISQFDSAEINPVSSEESGTNSQTSNSKNSHSQAVETTEGIEE
jgi:DNA mismatch repair ATPase MutL